MRDGTYVGSWHMDEISDDEIVKQMVGRELTNIYPPKNDTKAGEVLLDVRGYSSIHDRSFRIAPSPLEEADSWIRRPGRCSENGTDGRYLRYASY